MTIRIFPSRPSLFIFLCQVSSFYGTRESVVRALKELNSTSDEGIRKTTRYRIKDIVDNYEFFLVETNKSMTQVSQVSECHKIVQWNPAITAPLSRFPINKGQHF